MPNNNKLSVEQLSVQKAQEWLQNKAIDQADKKSTQQLLEQLALTNIDEQLQAKKEIIENFYKDLELGTGGIRGVLGMGLNRMNKYNVRRATYAFASVLKEIYGNDSIKVAISYDSRHFSFEFAEETASVLASFNITSLFYEHMNPVALLSFLIREENAHGGIMITASHNPSKYNGYKIYWGDGAQVTPPYDKKIIAVYNSLNNYEEFKTIPFQEAKEKGLIKMKGKETEDRYFSLVKEKAINPLLAKKEGGELHIVYTPLHGTGLLPCQRILKELGFTQVSLVKEQAEPNGDFPTVEKGPNPENPEALHLAVELMKQKKAHIVFGTDPDADRLGVAILNQGEVFYPNGNQIGILMFHYILNQLKEQNRLPSKCHMVKTIVTTPMLDLLAQKYQVEVSNTLTGFKWICKEMGEIEKQSLDLKIPNQFLFATEESFGYMHHNYVRDKDAISSLGLMAEIALWYKLKGLNLSEGLDKIYQEFGYYHESLLSLDYFGKEGAEKINRIMEFFRKSNLNSWCGEKITGIEDYQEQFSENVQSGERKKIKLPQSNVLGFSFEKGHRLYLRPSGTEPKIKFYTMIFWADGTLKEKKEKAKTKALEFENLIREKAQLA